MATYRVVQVVGDTNTYIAEVVKSEPLWLKITEEGPYSRLKQGDVVIDAVRSEKINGPWGDLVLQDAVEKGRPLVSALWSLGVRNNTLRKIFPVLPTGTMVRTTEPNQKLQGEWEEEAWVSRQWGVEGPIICSHNSHGLYYDVRHPDGTEGGYDPSEFVVVKPKA